MTCSASVAGPTTALDTRQGLSSAEVEERRQRGQINTAETATSRSVRGIVTANLFTRFNAIMTPLAVIVLVFGEPIDAAFALVMVANSSIGIIQEIRAKRTLDRLQLLIEPTITVIRDGGERSIAVDQLVIDDLIQLGAGDQVPVDGEVVASAGLEVDESALTGEAKPIRKAAGDLVRSGSAAVAGSADVVATHVGSDAWVHRLLAEAKEFVLTESELRRDVDRLLRVISWMLPPLTVLLFWSQLRGEADTAEGLVAATAGVVALVPQGLVLLVSMAMAVAVIALGRRKVVVQELAAVEGLARADVVCLDKTGTLTTGRTTVEAIEPIGAIDPDVASSALAALTATEPTPTKAMRTIGEVIGPAPTWQAIEVVPFSSARKWSAATFDTGWSWVIGAPEILLAALRSAGADADPDLDEVLDGLTERVRGLTGRARRVLLVGRSSRPLIDDHLPAGLEPVALVIMVEELRSDAADTLRYFGDEGFTVKIISGDSVDTVRAMGVELGIPGVERAVDLRSAESITSEIAEENTVFGRVLPEQKRDLVRALQLSGHSVVMTGDGVNDIPALKRADIGIAMDTATSATKAVSQLVLLDGRFDLLPGVLAEGRRVVANMERVSSLFLAKTAYATVFAISVALSGQPFPFLPRHLTVIDSLTIGIPAFILSFQPADAPCRPGYLRRVLQFAIPAGLAAAAVTLITYSLHRWAIDPPTDDQRTVSTVALLVMGFWILVALIRPLRRWHLVLLAVLIGTAISTFVIPPIADLFALTIPGPWSIVVVLATAAAVIPATHVIARRLDGWWIFGNDEPTSGATP
jgi:cation-transporting ATPase E